MTDKKKHCVFLDLYSKTQPRIYSFILMLVHSTHDADEIFQETSSLLWEKFDQYQVGTNFGAWAITIAKFQTLEYMRKKRSSKCVLSSEISRVIDDIAEQESSKIDRRLEALRYCLYKLDRISRSLLVARYQKNNSVKEIAEQKGVTVRVIYRRLTKIFANLRECINLSTVQ